MHHFQQSAPFWFKGIVIGIIMMMMGFIQPVVETPTSEKNTPWIVPKSADHLVNPIADDFASIEIGRHIYHSKCEVCHGKKGRGDGSAGLSIDPPPTDLTDQFVQNETDGALFYKITVGRLPMLGYGQSLKDEQRWALVNFLRTLKKK